MRNINLCFILILLVFNGSAGTSECTDERCVIAEDVENLMQFRIDVAKENNEDGFDESDDNSSKTLHVECEFLMMGSDGPHVSEASATTDSYAYGTCTTISHETYYLLDNDAIQNIFDGAWVQLVIEPIPTPRDLMADFPTPWKQLYAVQDVFSVFQTSRDTTRVNPERHHVSLVDSEYEPKPIDIMMLLCDFNDHKVSLSDALMKKYTYSNQSDWSDSTRPWIGSLSDMVDKSTYGRLKVNEPVVIRVAIDENWVGQACNIGSLISKCNAAAKKEGHDLTTATFKEYFIPQSPANGCWWCGMAVYGCGHPSMLPNPNGCWAIYRCHNVAMRGHELGHNLGLLHAGGGKDMYEYGDPETVMGNGYTFTGFIAAEKYQLGVLKSVAGEVIEWNPGMQNSMTISSISLPLNQVGANGVAVKVACPDCWPRTRGYKMLFGGFLWVQFRGDELYSSFNLPASYQNQVYIHLARRHLNPRHGKGTELWAKLGAGESYKPENFPYVFYVCKIEGDLAEIAIAASLSVAEGQCGTEFKPSNNDNNNDYRPSNNRGFCKSEQHLLDIDSSKSN